MTVKKLADKCEVTERHIRAETKKANESGALYVEFGGTKYSYDLVKQGRGRPSYHFEEQKIEVIKEDIDIPRLDLELDEKQQEKLDLKIKIMAEWNAWKSAKRGTVTDFRKYIEKHFDMKYTYRMHNAWTKAYNENGARGLIDTRGNKKGESLKLEEHQKRFLIMQFRAWGAGEMNYMQLWEELHRNEMRVNGFDFYGWLDKKVDSLCHRDTVKRFIDSYYENKVVEWTLITQGEDANKSYNQPAIGKRADSFTYKNECWEIDSTPADVIIFHEGKQIRPDIIAIKDCYSGRCVAHLATNSNKLATIRLLWKAIETLGRPKFIKGDNGKDYLSKQFQYLLTNLGIKYDRAIAFAGDEKGMVERNFRTIQHSYMRFMVGFIGHNVAHRQKIEAQVAKKNRKAKDSQGRAVMTQSASSEEMLSWNEFDMKLQEAVFLWEFNKQRRKGKTPVEKWNECPREIKTVSYETFLVYAGGDEVRKVHKDGIHLDGKQYVSTFIGKYVNHKVKVVRNIDDMSEVFVFDLSGKLIGVCVDRNVANISVEEHVQMKKEFEKDNRHIKATLKDDKVSARSKANIKVDYNKAKEELEKRVKPHKKVQVANVELQRDVEIKRQSNFINVSASEIVSDDVYLKYG